ncbi:MAG: hypothetical protein LUE26_06870 [Alistipes sp.]|nr:hypothetical protein [Alistipes sp.]
MELVPAGKFTRTFGKEGEVIAVLYDKFPAQYDKREPLYVLLDGLTVPFFISRLDRRGKSGALVVLDDVDNETRAGIILGREFLIPAAFAGETSDNGDDLAVFTGYTVVLTDTEGGTQITGIVTGIEGNDANPLFTIEIDGKEILVPANEEMITDVNLSKSILRIEIPPGLLDL